MSYRDNLEAAQLRILTLEAEIKELKGQSVSNTEDISSIPFRLWFGLTSLTSILLVSIVVPTIWPTMFPFCVGAVLLTYFLSRNFVPTKKVTKTRAQSLVDFAIAMPLDNWRFLNRNQYVAKFGKICNVDQLLFVSTIGYWSKYVKLGINMESIRLTFAQRKIIGQLIKRMAEHKETVSSLEEARLISDFLDNHGAANQEGL